MPPRSGSAGIRPARCARRPLDSRPDCARPLLTARQRGGAPWAPAGVPWRVAAMDGRANGPGASPPNPLGACSWRASGRRALRPERLPEHVPPVCRSHPCGSRGTWQVEPGWAFRPPGVTRPDSGRNPTGRILTGKTFRPTRMDGPGAPLRRAPLAGEVGKRFPRERGYATNGGRGPSPDQPGNGASRYGGAAQARDGSVPGPLRLARGRMRSLPSLAGPRIQGRVAG
jgi:hypothetical protein